MLRKSRNILGNIIIYNVVHGINQEYIFKNKIQKHKYYELIKEYSQKFNILIIAYCIMDNCAHLLTYSENTKDLSEFMKLVNMRYAIYYNKIKNRVGYVFRNRFYSKPILNQKQLYKSIKYIHMNPVKAKISRSKRDYEFSSFKYYCNQEKFYQSDIFKVIFYSNQNEVDKLRLTKYEQISFEKRDINLKQELEKFCVENKLESTKISEDSLKIKRFISYLISNKYKFTKKSIAEVLKISRTQLYRKLKGKNK